MSDTPKSWVKVCSLDDLPADHATAFNVGGLSIVAVRCGDSAYLLQGSCSHMYFPLHHSKVEGCVLTCGLHRSTFDVRDGSVIEWSTFPPLFGAALAAIRSSKALRAYSAKVEDGQVFMEWSTADPSSIKVTRR
jgi:3-phenylpropionate/trans-cinnamate dioxygenase ferredoxin component